MVDTLTDDELVAEYQKLEAAIEALHTEIERLQKAELTVQQARRNIEDIATDLVTRQGEVREELQKRAGETDPETLT